MWWLWLIFIATVVIAFAIVYQDWLIPRRRRIGYAEMRRQIRELQETEFWIDES